MGLASPIGEQVARLRMLRELTQEGLAAKSGVSVDVIRRLEQGARTSARLSSLARLAEALDVELSLLLAGPVMLAGAVSRGEDHPAGMLELRRSLTPADVFDGLAPEAEADAGETSLSALRSSARLAWQAYQAGDYSGVVVSLPGLIAELRHALTECAQQDIVETASLLATSCEIAAGIVIALGKEDLAFTAAERAVAAADASGSEITRACAANFATWIYRRQGRYAEAEAFAVRSAQRYEPTISQGDAGQMTVFGALLLNASGAAARADRADAARDLIGVARAAAARFQRDQADRRGVFGPTAVAMTAVSNAVEYGDLDEALRMVGDVPSAGRVPATWESRYLLNVAYAQCQTRRDLDAVATLLRVQALTPEWMRYQVQSRDVVAELVLRRGRTRTSGLSQLADHLGLTAS
jgi:transcriptional regulator with XRE-family HTH domain